jgi:hypothetical protein
MLTRCSALRLARSIVDARRLSGEGEDRDGDQQPGGYVVRKTNPSCGQRGGCGERENGGPPTVGGGHDSSREQGNSPSGEEPRHARKSESA